MSIQLKNSGNEGNNGGYVRNNTPVYNTPNNNTPNNNTPNNNTSAYNYGNQSSVGGSVPPTRYSQLTDHVDDSYYYTKPKRGGLDSDQIYTISEILGWIFFGTIILSAIIIFVFVFTGGGSMDKLYNTLKVVSTINIIAMLLDAAFQVFYRKNSFLLIVFALFLSGLYPLIRGKIVDGVIETRAIVSVALLMVAYLALCISIL